MTRILMGVDTEADDQWTVAGRESLTLRNVLELPRLQALCDRYGARPTYLVTYEVATDRESRAILRDLARRVEAAARRTALAAGAQNGGA